MSGSEYLICERCAWGGFALADARHIVYDTKNPFSWATADLRIAAMRMCVPACSRSRLKEPEGDLSDGTKK